VIHQTIEGDSNPAKIDAWFVVVCHRLLISTPTGSDLDEGPKSSTNCNTAPVVIPLHEGTLKGGRRGRALE
jgi:hypothetical protein